MIKPSTYRKINENKKSTHDKCFIGNNLLDKIETLFPFKVYIIF